MFNIHEKMGNFLTLHPRLTTALFSVGLTLGIGLVLSYVAPTHATHDALATLIRKQMLHPMITILHGGHIVVQLH
jgi:hypothetical protein